MMRFLRFWWQPVFSFVLIVLCISCFLIRVQCVNRSDTSRTRFEIWEPLWNYQYSKGHTSHVKRSLRILWILNPLFPPWSWFFRILAFPTARRTWLFDCSTSARHPTENRTGKGAIRIWFFFCYQNVCQLQKFEPFGFRCPSQRHGLIESVHRRVQTVLLRDLLKALHEHAEILQWVAPHCVRISRPFLSPTVCQSWVTESCGCQWST